VQFFRVIAKKFSKQIKVSLKQEMDAVIQDSEPALRAESVENET